MKKKVGSKEKSVADPRYNYIIKKIVEARKLAGLKQEAVAERINRFQSYISKIENCERRLDIVELLELAKVYSQDISFFVPKD